MNKTDQFLDLYKQVEDAAAARWGGDAGSVARLERMGQFSAYSQALRSCREVRNLLQHNPKIDGSYPAEPGGVLINVLSEVLVKIQNPTLAGDAAILLRSIFRRGTDDLVLPAMRQMAKRDISKIPITQSGCVVGVFSPESVFELALTADAPPLDETTRFADLRGFLAVDPRFYRFAPFNARLDEIEAMFDKAYDEHTRIRVVFLTEDGKQDKPLLGLITPWELIDKL